MYELDKEDYYEPIKINNAFNDIYIEYESSGDKDEILFIEEYHNMNKLYSSTMINNHQKKGK